MSDLFDTLVIPLLGAEGGYSNSPADAGGETMWGITAAVAREQGYAGAMIDMTRDQALDILRRRYWTAPGFDQVATISAPVASFLFDTGVNMGVETAGVMLQRLLNVLNEGGKIWLDLPKTGLVGVMTRTALQAFLTQRGAGGERVLLSALKALRDARYVELAEQAVRNETFEFGWLQRVLNLATPQAST